jgi:predicted nucleic acid-binding Zn ribbon protein
MAAYNSDRARWAKPLPLGEVLEKYLNQYALLGKLRQQRLLDSWEAVMGPAVASRTRRLWMDGTVLFVELTSAPLRTQMVQSTSRVLEILQQHAGKEAITEIVFR